MTDNIIKFPNRHLDVEVELDETEEEFEAYKKAVDNGEAKIKNFSEALEWCYNNYVSKNLTMEKF